MGVLARNDSESGDWDAHVRFVGRLDEGYSGVVSLNAMHFCSVL